MHTFFQIGEYQIPSYGLMIVLGIITANIIGLFILKKNDLDFNNFIVLEAYTFLGGFSGAKFLYLVIEFRNIDWLKIFNFEYFNQLMIGGFVFYGGLIGGLLTLFLGGYLHKIDVRPYIRHFIPLLPWIHSFGRIGCFLAGCCYGCAYDGRLSVIFPTDSYAPSGIPLFPVQLVEAILLLVLSLFLLYLEHTKKDFYILGAYIILYGIIRFFLEFYRGDLLRGHFGLLSTSQWISLISIILTFSYLIHNKLVKK